MQDKYERYRSHYYEPDDNADEHTTKELVMLIDQTDLNDLDARKDVRELCKNNPYARAYFLIKVTDYQADKDFKKYGRYAYRISAAAPASVLPCC